MQIYVNPRKGPTKGFTLIITLSMMILLTLIAIGFLSLSTISLRSASQGAAQAEARANARLALIVAIGELQKEMGPDMRISTESALLDNSPDTEEIEGVAQSRWLGCYNSWGSWLNASYSPPGGNALKISDTYTSGRSQMFRRWLLSLPAGMESQINSPRSASVANSPEWVTMVGEHSLGSGASADQTTRAYLVPIKEAGKKTGEHAWWISPENHKARIDKSKNPRTLSADAWQTAHGGTAEIGVGRLAGLNELDADATQSEKLITTQSLSPALEALGVSSGDAQATMQRHFFDLTAHSRGVLASVRTGHLKKDLSLLFEQEKSALPNPYRFNSGDIREPSIRPMSSEIANRPVLPNRHFASWTRMRHFYRMYRQDSDAEARSYANGGIDGRAGLTWAGSKPYTDCNIGTFYSGRGQSAGWGGEDSYARFPILTNLTYILSLKTELINSGRNAGKYDLRYVASPVCVYWNPYNVEMRIPDKKLAMRSYLAEVHNMEGLFYLNTALNRGEVLRFDDDYARIMSGNGQDVVFNPGEFRIFSPAGTSMVGGDKLDMLPGFDPQAFGGLFAQLSGFTPDQIPKFQMRFSHKFNSWKFNFRYGNTPASLVFREYWSPVGDNSGAYTNPPFHTHIDWFNTSQLFTFITPPTAPDAWVFDNQLLPVGYFQLAIKGIHDHDYPSIGWEKDWRCRNWIQAPPYYLGKGLYMSEDPTIGNTQRIDSPYELRFGPLAGAGLEPADIIQHFGRNAFLGIDERVTAVPSLELPSAPIGSLAGFGAMTINPGWVNLNTLNSAWKVGTAPAPNNNSSGNSLFRGESKAWAYQSGITGPGIGNSFLHPMIPRTDVYKYLNNSISMELKDVSDANAGYTPTDTQAYCDYWDHVLLLNDALWDDYFVSSLADQTRPGASSSVSLRQNVQKLARSEELANSRYMSYLGGRSAANVQAALDASDGYLKAASYLMVDGMFNVNSTSVDAWHALFAGIRERKVVYRDRNGALQTVEIPSGKRIALSRFNTADSNKDGNDPVFGITREDGMQAWSGVRFLDDVQLRKLAEECVKQVKRRGPFLNFSEFINRRLSNDDLGTRGALQYAIDYDDGSPQAASINYNFKNDTDFMLRVADLGNHAFSTPEAAVGSRFAGIPGYVIQSDLLNPIANTLAVRDDTFRIRAYGSSVDKENKVVARAWCEAVVQRLPEYSDETNQAHVPARTMSADGQFSDIAASELTPVNRRFGRRFQVESFRWLTAAEI